MFILEASGATRVLSHTLINLRASFGTPHPWAAKSASLMPLVHKITGKDTGPTFDALRTGTFPDPSDYIATESTKVLDVKLARHPATYFFAGHVYPRHGRSVFVIPPELDGQLSGFGSPFDSGGLVNHHCLAPNRTNTQQYLRLHECSLADFREYLGLHLTENFKSADTYLRGVPKAGIDGCLTKDDVKPLACAFEVRQEISLELSASVRVYVDEECYYESLDALNDNPDIAKTPQMFPVAHPDEAVEEYIRGVVSQ